MTAGMPRDWIGSIYKVLSIATACLALPVLAVVIFFGVAAPIYGMAGSPLISLSLVAVAVFNLLGWPAWIRLTFVFWRRGTFGLQQENRLWWGLLILGITLSLPWTIHSMRELVQGRHLMLSAFMLAAEISSFYLIFLRQRKDPNDVEELEVTEAN